MKGIELLEAACAAQKEADDEKEDLALKIEKSAKATEALAAFLTEAKKEDMDVESDPKPKKQSKKTEKKKEMKKDDEEADDAGDDDDDKDSKESQRIAVVSLAKEAGLSLKDHQVEKLVAMPFTEAKREIENYKDLKESIVAQIAALNVPAGHGGKLNESGRGSVTSNDDLFANLVR